MNCECEFQPTIPSHCVTEVINIIRAGVGSKKGELFMHFGCALGSIGAMLNQWENPSIGQQVAPPEQFTAMEDVPNTVPECLAKLQELQSQTQDNTFGSLQSQLARMILERLAQLLIDAIFNAN